MKNTLVLVLVCACTVVAAASRKKVILHGWDILAASPQDILAHASDFDRLPIDGVVISSNGRNRDGRAIHHRYLMTDPRWDYDVLDGEIDTLRKIVQHPSLRESFLGAWISTTGRRISWTDDEAWDRAANNIGVLAHVAKLGGLKGLALDPEDYRPLTEQYYRQPNDPDYVTLRGIVRRRGSQFFKAIFDEYPDVTLFSFWLLSQERRYRRTDDVKSMESMLGDLWPSFLNGMFDAMPKDAKFVDGDEHAYKYQAGRGEFFATVCNQLVHVLPLVAPEHRVRYRSELCASFALYPDAFSNAMSPGQYWYTPPKDGSRETHFRECLAEAFAAADEYVWLYGENGVWIDWEPSFYVKHYAKNIKTQYRRRWNEQFPGLYGYISILRDREEAERRLMVEDLGERPNMVSVGDKCAFRCDAKSMIGKAAVDGRPRGGMGKSLALRGTSRTCFTIPVAVTPGRFYVARVAYCGKTEPSASVWCLTGNEHRFDLPAVAFMFRDADADGWRVGTVLAYVPSGVDHLEINLGGEPGQDGECLYDEVYIGEYQ